jgi:hypothetical protein
MYPPANAGPGERAEQAEPYMISRGSCGSAAVARGITYSRFFGFSKPSVTGGNEIAQRQFSNRLALNGTTTRSVPKLVKTTTPAQMPERRSP